MIPKKQQEKLRRVIFKKKGHWIKNRIRFIIAERLLANGFSDTNEKSHFEKKKTCHNKKGRISN